MTQEPKNPNVEKVADIPFDKESISPVPPFTPRTRGAGSPETGMPPLSEVGGPEPKEEYPGPQHAPSGGHAEPGRVDPSKTVTPEPRGE